MGAPFAGPRQILFTGLDWRDQAAETGQAVAVEPIVFNEALNTLITPNDDVVVPPGSMKAGWEVELGVVIGRRSLYVADETEAAAAIAGYVLVNEVSEREWQVERGHQSVKGKSAPTVNSAGPSLASPDEIDDVLDPEMLLDVDAKRYQTGSRSTMLFGPTFLGHHLGQFIALELGDLVNTGTPLGVGVGQKPPRYLRGVETPELSVSRLGRQTQAVASHLQAGQ